MKWVKQMVFVRDIASVEERDWKNLSPKIVATSCTVDSR